MTAIPRIRHVNWISKSINLTIKSLRMKATGDSIDQYFPVVLFRLCCARPGGGTPM